MSNQVQAAGHAGCLAYARLAILLVFVANAMAYVVVPGLAAMVGMLAAAVSATAAYVAQMLFNHYESDTNANGEVFRRGQVAQIVSLMAGAASGLIALVAA